MTKESTAKKGMGWLKSIRSSQSQLVENNVGLTEEIIEVVENESPRNTKESIELDTQSKKNIFSKDDKDKVALDLIVSMENILKDRQLIQYRNNGLEDQLYTANETISRLKQDQMKKDQLLQEKNKEIRALEVSLTNKQMSYDQLLEDYKEYQNASNIEYEKISNQLETEINKYDKLNEESMNTQYQSMLKINELEEKVRSLEIENRRYVEQYQRIFDEKTELMQTINDFTERMSFSFSPKTATSNPSDSE